MGRGYSRMDRSLRQSRHDPATLSKGVVLLTRSSETVLRRSRKVDTIQRSSHWREFVLRDSLDRVESVLEPPSPFFFLVREITFLLSNVSMSILYGHHGYLKIR